MDLVTAANLIAASAAAVGLYLVAWQTREARKSRLLEATLFVFQDLGADASREDRRRLLRELTIVGDDLPAEQLALVESVTGRLERAAYLSMAGLADQAVVMGFYRATYAAVWAKLEPYVLGARRTRGARYLYGFEAFGRLAVDLGETRRQDLPIPRR